MFYPKQQPLQTLVFLLLNADAVIEGSKRAHSLLQAIREQARKKGQEHRYKFFMK